ncbi:hypothetical protein [Rugosimonospora africana]|uniref:Uncharacterized protein n=1 Tax=Rugosimonospora africana TaxID=556532 RepID=A0A8J3QWA2_9ACTN|nr:hypothetical protein [Rugosimonospora africana]GIH15906.1 hypothetical protein Raf01_40780 [Rugosimonospora africana]
MSTRYPTIEGELEDELESAYEAESEFEDELEGEYEYEDEGEEEAEYEFEFETEAELEAEGESEDFVNPVRRIYPDAELMAHFAHSAASAESEAEAEAFIGALLPLAAKLIPRAAPLVRRLAPTLVRGATRVVRQLRSNPQTRKLVSALPVIAQRTVQSLADQAAGGRDITGNSVFRTLGDMTSRVLSDPDSARRATNAVAVFDRRWHARNRRRTGTYRRPARRPIRSAARSRRVRSRVR